MDILRQIGYLLVTVLTLRLITVNHSRGLVNKKLPSQATELSDGKITSFAALGSILSPLKIGRRMQDQATCAS
jgi:hypothetical protein